MTPSNALTASTSYGVAADVLFSQDMLACVCAHCDTLISAESLLNTCRRLRHVARDDDFYHLVAVLQWGREFWDDARRRPTRRVFCSMRQELQRLDCFQRCLRRHGFPVWREADFRRLWKAESARNGLSSAV